MMCKRPFIRSPGGVKGITKTYKEGRLAGTPFPCGYCLPCRIQKGREWTARLLLENMAHTLSCFVTLTYSEEKIPEYGSLRPDHLRNFLKRLRNYISPTKIRYYACGEYGDESLRPHYHLMLFGIGYESEKLIDKAWNNEDVPTGFTMVGDVNHTTARYVTKYCVKKLNNHSDEILKMFPWFSEKMHPEFMRCSKQKGGLGIEVAKAIKEKMKYYGKEEYIEKVNIGKRKMPLGRYLKDKVNEDIHPIIKEKKLYDYQEEIFKLGDNGDGSYYENIVNGKEQERKQLEARYKIFAGRRVI